MSSKNAMFYLVEQTPSGYESAFNALLYMQNRELITALEQAAMSEDFSHYIETSMGYVFRMLPTIVGITIKIGKEDYIFQYDGKRITYLCLSETPDRDR